MTKTISFRRPDIFVHDAKELKNFWEKIIEKHTQQQQGEDSRLSRSALKNNSDVNGPRGWKAE
ncbi:unnamed protein product [Natator depressus]